MREKMARKSSIGFIYNQSKRLTKLTLWTVIMITQFEICL